MKHIIKCLTATTYKSSYGRPGRSKLLDVSALLGVFSAIQAAIPQARIPDEYQWLFVLAIAGIVGYLRAITRVPLQDK